MNEFIPKHAMKIFDRKFSSVYARDSLLIFQGNRDLKRGMTYCTECLVVVNLEKLVLPERRGPPIKTAEKDLIASLRDFSSKRVMYIFAILKCYFKLSRIISSALIKL